MYPESQDLIRFLQTENVRLQNESQQLRYEITMLRHALQALHTIQKVTAQIDIHTNPIQMLDQILAAALLSIGANDGSLSLVDDKEQELVFVVVHGAVRDSLVGHRMKLGTGIAGWVAQHGEPIMARNARLHPRFSQEVDNTYQFYTHSMITVPIVTGERITGVIQALNKGYQEEFTEGDLSVLGVVAQLAAGAISRAEALEPPQEGQATTED